MIIRSLNEFNKLSEENKKIINDNLNEQFVLYHFTYKVLIGNNTIVTGKTNQLILKRNSNLFNLETLESIFKYCASDIEGALPQNVFIINSTQLLVDAYSYFKLMPNGCITL